MIIGDFSTDISMKHVANNIKMTIKVKRVREYRFRVWLAQKLIELAGKIAWLDVEVKEVI